MTDDLIAALGAGWLGKALGGIAIAITGAWTGYWARRKADEVAMATIIDARFRLLLERSDRSEATATARAEKALARCDELQQMAADERAHCDARLSAMQATIDELMSGPVAGYVTLMRAGPKPEGA